MPLELVSVRPGPTATEWLVGRVRELQDGDPLRPVTVVVPSHHAGLHLRRRLAARGYANVRFTVLARLAESLGAARLAAAGEAPLTAVTRAALVRGAVRDAGGPLVAAAEHAGLVDLVAALAADLRRSGDAASARSRILAAATPTSRAAVAAVDEYERRRAAARLHDDVDLLTAAADTVACGDADGALREVGAVVVHLPARLDAPEARLVRVLAGRVPTTVAHSALGEPAVDALVPAALGDTAVTTVTAATAPHEPATVHVVMATDPVDEVSAAVRGVLVAMERDSVPMQRTAIVYRDEETYGTVLRDTLGAAGIPYVALGGRPLADSVAARGLLGLVRLREQDFTRPAVLGWLSGIPHRGGVLRSQARWDQLSRDARVVRGVEQWRTLLGALADARAHTLSVLDDEEGDQEGVVETRRAALLRDVEDARRIVEHITAIDTTTRPPAEHTWEAHVAWAHRLLDEYLTPDPAWETEDREARQMVAEVVASLGAAQAVEPTVSVQVFLRTLEDGLHARVRPEGRLGRGVVIGPHRLLCGMDLDRVHVLGVLEAVFPSPAPVDPLLATDPLDRRGTREVEERRDWLLTLAAADGGTVTLSAPVVDLDGRAAYPSPWLLETLADEGGHPRASAVRDGSARHPRLHRPGGHDDPAVTATPLSLAERREAEAAAARAAATPVERTALARRDDLPLGRGLATTRARRSRVLTAFDGDAGDAAALPIVARGLGDATQSPTGVETWATCPFRYLLAKLLVVRPTEDADDDRWWQIDAAERGTLIHAVLEHFFGEVARTGHPTPGTPYGDVEIRLMERLAEQAFADAERRGVTGHPLVWVNERAAILADLRTLLREDAERRAEGWRPHRLEQHFGFDGEGSWEAVRVPLPDGRTVLLRGKIDRVDVGAADRARVVDYKTGSYRAAAIDVANRLDAGRRLQLPVYGRAVRDHIRTETGVAPTTTALYWYATARGGFKEVPITVDERVEEALDDVVARIDAGVRAGCFPQVPGEHQDWGRSGYANCVFCDYDTLCPAGRDVLCAAKADSDAVAPYRALRPDDAPPSEAGT